MQLGALLFRLRMWIHALILALGFWSPWLGLFPSGRRISTWVWAALQMSRSGLVPFRSAVTMVMVAGALAAAAGAAFRVWGAAYLGYTTVQHGRMQAGALVAAGPYRHLRNPLYLGGWFTTLSVSLLMPPTGALFAVTLMTLFLLRGVLAEEAFLAARLGEPYRAYLRQAPRWLPQLRSSLPALPARPRWGQALLTELMPLGVFFTMALLAWTYNNLLLIKTIVIVFGVSLIARGLAPSENSGAPVRSK